MVRDGYVHRGAPRTYREYGEVLMGSVMEEIPRRHARCKSSLPTDHQPGGRHQGYGTLVEWRPGDRRCVAVARALANDPRLLLADEPTGNLDPDSSEQVFSLLLDLVKKTGVAALIATHNPVLAGKMDRVMRLENGTLVPN